jgi:hypothetical protein
MLGIVLPGKKRVGRTFRCMGMDKVRFVLGAAEAPAFFFVLRTYSFVQLKSAIF